MKIVIDDRIPFIKGAFEPFAEVVYLPGAKTTAEDVKDADAVITRTRTKCDASLLEGSSVKIIASATIGYDHIDTEWCEGHGIEWTNAPGCNSWSVKQYISSVLVTLAGKHSLDLSRITLGVVGVGNVGSKVAEAAGILGCRVLLNDPPRAEKEGPEGFVDLDTIIRESDIITLHVPLSPKESRHGTWHLFDAARIASLRPDQILINSSRGPVVDNNALRKALEEKKIRAAVLDVWENEPDIDTALMDLLDITTPHIAGYSADGKANGTTMSVRAVAAKLGLPLTEWKAAGIPLPEQPLIIVLNAKGMPRQEALTAAIRCTYDVTKDSDRLRSDPASFEKQRGEYPVRREPTAFTVKLLNGHSGIAGALMKLGFNVENIENERTI